MKGFEQVARSHGLLADYDEVIEDISLINTGGLNGILKIAKTIFWNCFLFALFIFLISNGSSWFAGLILFLWCAFWMLERKLVEYAKSSKKQNDIIIRSINKDFIAAEVLNYRASLIACGWVETRLPESFLKKLCEISKKYWEHDRRLYSWTLDDKSKELSELFIKAQETIKNNNCQLESLLGLLNNIERITDDPFINNAVSERLNAMRTDFIDKLKQFSNENEEFIVMLNKAEKINAVHRAVHFDSDRVSAYKMFFEKNYGEFIQQLINWSGSEEGLQKIRKFTCPSSISLELLFKFLDDPIIFETLAKSLVSEALSSLESEILNSDRQCYLLQRLPALLNTIEGRHQVMNDLTRLHEMHFIYMKLMLHIVQAPEHVYEYGESYESGLLNEAISLIDTFICGIRENNI